MVRQSNKNATVNEIRRYLANWRQKGLVRSHEERLGS